MLELTKATPSDRDVTGLNWEFSYKGKIYPINLYYDTVLSFYKLLDDSHFSDSEKVSIAFEMFFNDEIQSVDMAVEAFEQISKYLSADPYEDNQEVKEHDDMSDVGTSVKYYSFEKDAEAIYASFMQQYGIDLLQQKQKMHWDQFKALFAGLGPDTYFMRIVRIRQEDASKLDGQAQADLIQAQQHYALEQSQETIQNQMNDFGNMLKALAQS